MGGIKDAAQNSSGNSLIPASVKQEPKSDSETDEENMNNVLDYQVIKAQLKNDSDCTDAVMRDSDIDEDLVVKFEVGDPRLIFFTFINNIATLKGSTRLSSFSDK